VTALDAASLAPALVGGAAVGSFLGVVAARVPPLLMENAEGRVSPRRLISALSIPASHCDHCRTPIAWRDNIPVLSWLVLRGRCRACGHDFGAASLLLEAAAAGAALLSVHLFGWSLEGGLCFLLLALLLALSAIDLKEMLLPDILVLPLLPAGLLFQALYGDGLVSGLIGAGVAFAILWAIGIGYGLARRVEGLGGGDVKLAGALGAWLGIAKIPFFLLGSFAGGVLVMGLVLALSRRDAKTQLPFGPFLAASAAFFVLMPGAHALLAQLIAG
jgi:prepilin signal peptidase PulO-like enzyme (type II secretory pathway)